MRAVSDDQEIPPGESPGEEPSSPRLRPARPDPEELEGRPGYMPTIPWKWVVVGAVALAGVYFGYQYREAARADAMRDQILATHEEHLASIVERYGTFRERIEGWTLEAATAGEPERWVDPRLRISGLHGGAGRYPRHFPRVNEVPNGKLGRPAMADRYLANQMARRPNQMDPSSLLAHFHLQKVSRMHRKRDYHLQVARHARMCHWALLAYAPPTISDHQDVKEQQLVCPHRCRGAFFATPPRMPTCCLRASREMSVLEKGEAPSRCTS